MARQMKDSGVEWIGEIPEEWDILPAKRMFRNSAETKKAGDIQLTSSQQYGIISQNDYMAMTGSRVVLATQDLEKWKHVEPLDFIISLRSFQGGLEMSEVTGCITWHYVVLRSCHEGINAKFYRWLFKSSEYITALQRTCNYIRDGQDLRYSNFEQVPLFLPKEEEQEIIANILDSKCAEIDKVVERTCATIEEYKKLKQAIITEAVTKGVRGPRPMKPSGVEWIGDIPEEWRVKRIKYEVSMRNEKGIYHPKIHKYIGLENIEGFSNILVDTESTYAEAEYQICRKGDVMYSRLRPYLCKSVICPIDGFCTGELMIFSHFTGDKRFLRYWLLSEPVTTVIMQSTYGTKMPRANPSYILNLPFCLPETTEQQEIAAYLDAKCTEIDRIIEKKEQLIDELGSYKKSLIYEYVTGKKEVETNMEQKVPYSD